MKLLTFLGTGPYGETEYALGEQRRVTRYAPVASCAFLQPSGLVVFATQEAEAAHGAALQGEAGLPTRFVPVPKGQNTDELWTIFRQVAEAVAEGEQVAFDVTHGLRSFPLIGLLAAAFLRAARRAELAAVLYGAYDVRDQSVTPNRTPMFDLSPMMALLEWAAATDRFKRFGDGRDLAALLRAAKDKSVRASGFASDVIEKVKGLDSAAGTLESTALALRLIRPHEAMQAAAGIPAALKRARPAIEATLAIQPFELLSEDIEQALSPIAFDKPDDQTQIWETLTVTRRMIGWCVEKQQFVQAITLAREWLVSWAMAHIGEYDLRNRELRESVTSVFNSESRRWRETSAKAQFRPLWFRAVPGLTQALSLWNDLADTRNDIDHAGMRKNPRPAKDLVEQIKQLCRQLDALSLVAGNPTISADPEEQ